MENITSSTSFNEQPFIEIPSDVGVNGRLRISGDPGVMEALHEQQVSAQRQAVLEAPQRALRAVGGYLGSIANNIKLEARMAVHDSIYGTNFREERHTLIDKRRNERFAASIGLVAVRKP